MRLPDVFRIVVAVLALAATAAPTAAQSPVVERAYATVGLFGDVKRFSGDPTESTLDGQVTGGSVAIGTFIGTRWGLQVGLDVSGFSRTQHPRDITFQRVTITLTSVAENQALSVATLLRFRASSRGRVRLGYLGGLTFVRLDRKFHTTAPIGTPSALIPRPAERVDYSAAPTVGIDARIELTPHLALVPGLHACVFRLSDESGLLVRPRIGLRWAF
jgi:outer membrane protein with beta-barrel domain